MDHIFILLIIIHPQCYLYLHKVFIHCPCPLLLCGKIHFHRWKVNVLFLWAFSKAIISALCSYLLFCASLGSVFTSFLLLSFSWRLRILTGYAQGKWEHLTLKCRTLLKIFCPVFRALVKFNKVQLCRTNPHPARKSALQQKSWGLTAEPIVWYDHSIVIRIVIRNRCFRHNCVPHSFYASFGFS